MKKLLLTSALVAMTATLSYAQGTVTFQNTFLSAAKLVTPGVSTVSVPSGTAINYGLFWGTSADNLTLVPTLGTPSTTAGVIIAPNPFQIPGSTSSQTGVYLQVKAWDSSFGSNWQAASTQGNWFGQTAVIQTSLGPTAGPGTVLWQGSTGTATDRFTPLLINAVVPVPEPTSFALAGLGAAALLIFRRRN